MATSITFDGTSYSVPGSKETGWADLSDYLIDLATLTDGAIMIGNASGQPQARTLSGDVTVSNTGVTSIGSAKITDAMLSLTTPALGTPSAVVLTNATGLPEAQVTQHTAAIDHDALTNFVANEHIDWTGATSDFSTTSTATTTNSFYVSGTNTSGHTGYFYSNSVQTGNTLKVHQDHATATGLSLIHI